MKFEELFFSILDEQVNPDDEGQPIDNDEQPETDNQQTDDEHTDDDEQKDTNVKNKPQKIRQLSEKDKIKQKWIASQPGLDNTDMNNTIDFFNRRKNGLRIYKDPNTPNYINMPEITALYVRFPDLRNVLTDSQKIRDLQNYSWDQIEFYMDRVGQEAATNEMGFRIEGDTPETRLASALSKWEDPKGRVMSEDNITVYKIDCKNDAIRMGGLQNVLVEKYGGQAWCITYLPDGNRINLYNSYRSTHKRAFYMVLDKNLPENHPFYFSTIEPIENDYDNFCITPRPNGTQCGKSWRDIETIHPYLEGKKDIFRYFGPTQKEKVEIELDKINFIEGSPFDFSTLNLNLQKNYIESNRYIPNKRSFYVLPEQLRKTYVAMTTKEDYKVRFKCDNTSDPFGIINILEKENLPLFNFLDKSILKERFGIKLGVTAIKTAILGLNYRKGFSDVNDKYVMFIQKYENKFGIMDITNLSWVKPLDFIKTSTIQLVRKVINDNGQTEIKTYILNRYSGVAEHNDYFYFLLNIKDITNKSSQNYMRGKYYDKEDGDILLKSPEFRHIK